MYFDHIYFLNFSLTPLSTHTSLCTQLERFLFPFKPLESNLCHLTILGSETFEPGLVAHASNPECQKAEARGFSTCEASLVYIESTRVARGTHLDSGFKNNFFPNITIQMWAEQIGYQWTCQTDGEKPMRPQPHTKSLGSWGKLGSGEVVLPWEAHTSWLSVLSQLWNHTYK